MTACGPPDSTTIHPDRPRYHSLDALRTWAMFLGIVLHAAIMYTTLFDRSQFPLMDRSPTDSLNEFIQWVHCFRMELFFMLSGFFGCMVMQYRGLRYFIRQRVKKLLVPFAVSLPIVLFVGEAVFVHHEYAHFGFRSDESFLTVWGTTIVSEEFRNRLRPAVDGMGLGTRHLWFLYYLLMFVATHATVAAVSWPRTLVNLWDRLVRATDWTLGSPWRIVVPAVVMIPLVPRRKWYEALEAPNNLFPDLRYYLYFGATYAAGYLLYVNRHRLDELQSKWGRYVLISAVGLIGIMTRAWIFPINRVDLQDGARQGFAFGHASPASEFATFEQELSLPFLNAFVDGPASVNAADLLIWAPPLGVTLAMLASCLALVGIFQQFCNRPSRWVRYWSDSAYFLYIYHLLATFWISSLLSPLPWHGLLKAAANMVVTTAVGLVLYEYCVRYTFIGTQLNGPRQRPAREPVPTSPA